MKKLSTFSILVFLMAIFSATLFAQSGQGKLAGEVVDAETGEPLIGANVLLENTSMGAATDANGKYFILNITPGTYDVRVSYVGYSTKILEDVRVVGGVTKELNVELSPGIEMETVVVSGEQRFFEDKATNTNKVVDSDDIDRLPVQGVSQIASLESGVVSQEGSGGVDGNASINVRGGRGGEVLYIVDGVPQNDLYTGSNYNQVADAAIEQMSFQIGGYEAKYGQAQSGIINITTKSGSPTYRVFADVVTSEFTDDYGFNEYTATLSGPIIPGMKDHTFFFSGERGWYLDADPKAIGLKFESIGKESTIKPDNESGVWRFSAKTNHNLGDFKLSLSANVNKRNFRGYVHSYAKNNSSHNPYRERLNGSYSAKITQNVSSNTYWTLSAGYKNIFYESGDGVWKDDLLLYGDSLANAQIGTEFPRGQHRVLFDQYGMFADTGRVFADYTKRKTETFNADLDFTTQLGDHLIGAGGGLNYNSLRYYSLNPINLAVFDNLPVATRFDTIQPDRYGYDAMGNEISGEGIESTKHPIVAYGYLQDRYELDDLVLNVGVRVDYFDADADILRDPTLPFGFGESNDYDPNDFVEKDPEIYVSPRIGIGFPVTESTVFHAQYGKFVQPPTLNNIYAGRSSLEFLIRDSDWSFNNGHVNSEKTTQYEIGFRQRFGNTAGLNITAFYKNTEGLVNLTTVNFQRSQGGETLQYYAPTNTDFGTVKGLAFSLDVARLSYFNFALDYTYSLAEGTGSSQSGNLVATFRNTDGDIPKVIAPLSFDQRHTGNINVSFNVPEDELGFLELTSANVLIQFNSGRPYTPLKKQNLVAGETNYGDTKGYVNSEYGPGTFRVDLKLEKSVKLGNLRITPYLWVKNVFDNVNEIDPYRSTGSAYTTGFLSTAEGESLVRAQGEGWAQDYRALERNPYNFGIPRMVRLGVKVNVGNISL